MHWARLRTLNSRWRDDGYQEHWQEGRREGPSRQYHRGSSRERGDLEVPARHLQQVHPGAPGPAAEKNREKIAEIDAILSRGRHVRKAPVFKNGKRIGTKEKELALLPSERAKLMAQRARLESTLTRKAPDELRRDFLAILPEYAAKNGLTREILVTVGVPTEDLHAAGL